MPSHPLENGRKWGIWTFEESTFTLEVPRSISDQQVDLEAMRSAGDMLGRMAQLRTKTWADSKVIGDLFTAFDDIFPLHSILHAQDDFDASGWLRKRLER